MEASSIKAILCLVNIEMMLITNVFSCAFSSVSTVCHVDEPRPREEPSRLALRVENTYQLGVLPTC